jgi:sorbose reductase
MVRRLPDLSALEPASWSDEKQAPEDSAMKNGIFNEDNTKPPSETRVFPLFSLKHKTAIVSGSDRGIGLAVVKAFAEAGANVAIWYHSNKDALKRAKEIEDEYGVKCMVQSLPYDSADRIPNARPGKAYATDITSYEDTKKIINEIARDFNGRLDIFVANAGIPWTQGRMIDGELSHYHKVVSTDLDSVFYCAKAAGEIFRKQYEAGGLNLMGEKMQNYSYGSFIATSSMSGHIANIPQLQAAVSFHSNSRFPYPLTDAWG